MEVDNRTKSRPKAVRHRPNVFLLSGRGSAAALEAPHSRIVIPLGKRAYVRVLNAGYQWARVSLGGQPFQVVASDGRPMRKFVPAKVWEMGPGERYDLWIQGLTRGSHVAKIEYLDDYTGKVLGEVRTEFRVT